jgi:hypothetical protein
MDHTWFGLIILCLAIILGYEAIALWTGRQTLSRYTVRGCRNYPLIPFVVGLIVGGLAVHFWLPWCPDICPPT